MFIKEKIRPRPDGVKDQYHEYERKQDGSHCPARRLPIRGSVYGIANRRIALPRLVK
jgi:hypothetical protein